MNKLKITLGAGLLLVCLTGTTLANGNVYTLLNSIQNIVWATLTGENVNTETTNIIILRDPRDDCPVRDCGDCRPSNPTCRPRE